MRLRDIRTACRVFQDVEQVLARLDALGQPPAQAAMEEWASGNQGIILAVLTWAANEVRVLEQDIATVEGQLAGLNLPARQVPQVSAVAARHAHPSPPALVAQQAGAASCLAEINLYAVPEPNSSPNGGLLLVFLNIEWTHVDRTSV